MRPVSACLFFACPPACFSCDSWLVLNTRLLHLPCAFLSSSCRRSTKQMLQLTREHMCSGGSILAGLMLRPVFRKQQKRACVCLCVRARSGCPAGTGAALSGRVSGEWTDGRHAACTCSAATGWGLRQARLLPRSPVHTREVVRQGSLRRVGWGSCNWQGQ